MLKTKKEEYNEEEYRVQDESLLKLRAWMDDVEPIKLVKVSEDLMTQMLENWSKFRITILKNLNQQENKILDAMARLRKEVQWLNQIKSGQTPELNKITSKLFKQCQEFQQKQINFSLKLMKKQSKLFADNILDSIKTVFQQIRQKIVQLVQKIKQSTSIKEILTEKTYFRFLERKHHHEIELISEMTITAHNESHDLDFGAVIGPALTQTNNRLTLRIDRNDKYQSFIGLGICHPQIVKQNYYKGSGLGSGCYLIRQESSPSHTASLSHAYEKDGSERRPKTMSWGFGQGDIVVIEIDFRRKVVRFGKDQEEYQMRVQLGQGALCGYVVLKSKWDVVSVVNM